MAVKKIEPSNMMIAYFNFGYEDKLLISAEDAATLIGIIGRANTINIPYREDPSYKPGVKPDLFSVIPYPTETITDLKKATFLGITLTEYREGKENAKPVPRESKESV
jgi:hypothetical protein